MKRRVMTKPDYEGAFQIVDWSVADDMEETVHLTVQIEPRGQTRNTRITFPAGLTSTVNPAQWGMKGEQSHETALPVALAAFSVAAASNLAKGKERDALRPVDGDTFLERLLGADPADDETIWRHIVKRVYWTWRFGLPSTVFDYTDAILLGLPREKKIGGLWPGQIDRVAQAGEGIYWKHQDDGSYQLRRDLLTGYSDAGSPALNP